MPSDDERASVDDFVSTPFRTAAGLPPRTERQLRDIARAQAEEARAGRLEADGQGVIAASPAPPG